MPEQPNAPSDSLENLLENRLASLKQFDDVCTSEDNEYLKRVFGSIPQLNGPRLELPATWDGKYRLIRYLGGGMSDVYLAEQLSLNNRAVVVKILPTVAKTDARKLKLFQQEGETLVKANGENIVFPIDYAVCDQHPYLVMEYVPGETLAELMTASEFDESTIAKVIASAARSLAAAHSSGIVHGDIKPANMIVKPDRSVKLIDFGLSGFFEKEERSRFGGSLPYAAPEQLSGGQVDARTDIYCLGVVLRNLLTAAQNRHGGTLPSDRDSVYKASELTKLADQMTAFAKEQRPTNAHAVAASLEHISESQTTQRRGKFVVATAVVFLLAALTTGWFVWSGQNDQPRGWAKGLGTNLSSTSQSSQRSESASAVTDATRQLDAHSQARISTSGSQPAASIVGQRSDAAETPHPTSAIAAGSVLGLSPSGRFIVAKSTQDDRHQIIELKTGTVIGNFEALSGHGTNWNADESKLMVAGRDGLLSHVTIVSNSGQQLHRWSTSFCVHAEMSPTGDRILFHDSKLRMSDISGKAIPAFVAPTESFRGWANLNQTSSWSPDGSKFAFYDEPASKVLVYTKDGGLPLKKVKVSRPGFYRFRWLRSGTEFSSLNHIYDFDGNARRLPRTEGTDRVFNPDETQWVTSDGMVGLATGRTVHLEGFFEKGFTVWNSPEVITSVNAAHPGHFREFNPNGGLIREIKPPVK